MKELRRIEAFSIRFSYFFRFVFFRIHQEWNIYLFFFLCLSYSRMDVRTCMWKYNVSITYREGAKKGHVEKKWKHRRRKKKLFQHPWSDTWMAIYHITVKENSLYLFLFIPYYRYLKLLLTANERQVKFVSWKRKKKKKQRWNWSQINKQRNLFSILHLHNCLRLNFLILILTIYFFLLFYLSHNSGLSVTIFNISSSIPWHIERTQMKKRKNNNFFLSKKRRKIFYLFDVCDVT